MAQINLKFLFISLNCLPACLRKCLQELDVRTRSVVIDDAFALAEAGLLQYEVALNITRYLRNEKEFLPWTKAFVGFDKIQRYFGDEPEVQDMRVRQFYLEMSTNC